MFIVKINAIINKICEHVFFEKITPPYVNPSHQSEGLTFRKIMKYVLKLVKIKSIFYRII